MISTGEILSGVRTASSCWSEDNTAAASTFDSKNCWVADDDDVFQWLELDFEQRCELRAVRTKGGKFRAVDGRATGWSGGDRRCCVKKYEVDFFDQGIWSQLGTFDGNVVKEPFDPHDFAEVSFVPVLAQKLRLRPRSWQCSIAMKVEALGVPFDAIPHRVVTCSLLPSDAFGNVAVECSSLNGAKLANISASLVEPSLTILWLREMLTKELAEPIHRIRIVTTRAHILRDEEDLACLGEASPRPEEEPLSVISAQPETTSPTAAMLRGISASLRSFAMSRLISNQRDLSPTRERVSTRTCCCFPLLS